MHCKSVIVLATLMLGIWGSSAQAQAPNYGKVIKSTQNVGVLGNDLAGDSTNFHTGNTSFEAQDLALPGNNGLEVAVGRSYGVGFERMRASRAHPTLPRTVLNETRLYAFGDWELDIPSISGVFTQQQGWQIDSTTPLNRCSIIGQVKANGTAATGEPKGQTTQGAPSDFWSGNTLHASGRDQTMLLATLPNSNRPSTGGPYHWVTKDNWWISCLPSIENGAGEGFLAVAPNGTKYWFNWSSRRNVGQISVTESENPSGDGPPYRNYHTYLAEISMLPTRVEDRFGNWVRYEYSTDAYARLRFITSSDGRQLSLNYNAAGFVETLSDGTRTVRYEYNGFSLSRVVLPDNSSWQYGFNNLSALGAHVPNSEYQRCQQTGDFVNFNCVGWPRIELSGTPTGYVVHPAGSRIDFTFSMHFMATAPAAGSQQYSGSWAFGIADKTISGPGITPMKWYYAFAPTLVQTQVECRAGVCPTTRVWTDEISPDYRITRRMFGMQRNDAGMLLQVLRGVIPVSAGTMTAPTTSTRITRSMRMNDIDIVDNPTPVTTTGTTITGPPQFYEEIVYTYRTGPRLGAIPLLWQDPNVHIQWGERQRTTSKRQTYLQNAVFTYEVNIWDSLDRPTSVSRFSSITPHFVKTETTTYHDDTARWILGQVKRSTTNGIETSSTDFDSYSLPWKTYSFGKPQQTLAYTLAAGSQAGTLNTVTDGRGLTTTLSDWYRGIPRSIQHPPTVEAPGGAVQSATVNNIGSVTSVTDENGYVTGYGYDLMGRLGSIVYPIGDSTNWTTTTISFTGGHPAEYGLLAGHWRQYVATGNARTVTFFDALWRPVIKETYDAGNINGTLAQTVTRYDSEGNTTFASYPQRNLTAAVIGTWANPLQAPDALGVHTGYDALNRAVHSKQNSEHGLLTTTTEYLDNFKTRVTNPRGVKTFTSYRVYDQPSFNLPDDIRHAEDTADAAVTEIHRDIFGKPTRLVRRNAIGNVRADRFYVYRPDWQTLCKVIEPETGATVMDYDAAGNLGWSASGLSLPSTTDCNLGEAGNSGRVVARTYDDRNRLKTLVFPDGNGNQEWKYWADGAPSQLTTWNIPSAGAPAKRIVNTYVYNRRRLLTTESVALEGWWTFNVGYDYDGNGSLASHSYPSTQTVSYAPNALGQPTQAGSYATNVTYHPNGAIAGFTYGNGVQHAMLQNERQLPLRVTSSHGVAGYEYGYDLNGNPTQMFDQVRGNDFSRGNQYDNLDRLTASGSASYGGDHWHRFTYDALDNLKSWKLGGVKDYANYYYEPGTNRLTNIQKTDSSSEVGIGYDLQGNVANKNGHLYAFDFGNRLRQSSNPTATERYRYDAHGRRVLASRTSGPTDAIGVIFSQYASRGQLMYQRNERPGVAKDIDQIYLGGSLVAQRETPVGGGVATVKYQHTDALGSLVAVTDQGRNVIERMAYESFGTTIGGPAKDGPGYTGHVRDAATGMNYMQQRYYDPSIGRFLSVDPVSADPNSGAMFNRYAYAFNNPYAFTDPDGRRPKSLGASGTQPDPDAQQKERDQRKEEEERARKEQEEAERKARWAALVKNVHDGHLTFTEARAWYKAGNGQQVAVDASRLTVMLTKNSDGSVRAAVTGADWLVHGNVTVNFKNMKIFDGLYDFEWHPMNNSQDVLRNAQNVGGRLINGSGVPYWIHYQGVPNFIDNRNVPPPTLPRLPSH